MHIAAQAAAPCHLLAGLAAADLADVESESDGAAIFQSSIGRDAERLPSDAQAFEH